MRTLKCICTCHALNNFVKRDIDAERVGFIRTIGYKGAEKAMHVPTNLLGQRHAGIRREQPRQLNHIIRMLANILSVHRFACGFTSAEI